MTKTEFISALADKSGLSKKEADAVIKSFAEIVGEELKKGEKIQLVGFGNFELVERPARTGRNPQTGEPMKIAASRSVKFKPGKALKDML